MHTLIKCCGLTNPLEADYLKEQKIDFAGIVLFFPKSKRNCSIEQAEDILNALSDEIKRVAVVVSPTPEQILEIQGIKPAKKKGFDYIQIHGELTEEMLQALTLPVLKAFNVSDMAQYPRYHALKQVVGYVFDANEPGSGKVFDWKLVEKVPRDEKLLLLAGGLDSTNVEEAIRIIHPDGVDVSSGIEYVDRPGKDPLKIEAFAKKVRSV